MTGAILMVDDVLQMGLTNQDAKRIADLYSAASEDGERPGSADEPE